MNLEECLGIPALFHVIDGQGDIEGLSERERRLLVGALNFHALMSPARRFSVNVFQGAWDVTPRTTGDETFHGLNRAFRSRLFTLLVESSVEPEERTSLAAEKNARSLEASSVRHLVISPDEVLSFDPPRGLHTDLLRRTLRKIRNQFPLIYDEARDVELLRHRTNLVSPAPRRAYEAEFQPGGPHADSEIVEVGPAPEGAPRAVLFGLHWLEMGGAERWAFESVKLAREAGLLPIVMTNQDSHQPLITAPELDGALLVPMSPGTVFSQTAGVEELLRAVFRSFDVRGVVVHHNQWLYDRLHWIRRSRPDLPIVDSTHIIEYRGGGFPVSSVLVENAITTHHVISPSLAQWMTEVQKVPAERVVMAPLGGLTVDSEGAQFVERVPELPFTVAFIGRMARQKAPEVFVEIANRVRSSGEQIRFIMHGDGELASWVDDLIARHQLRDVVIRRDSSIPVSETLDDADLLLVTSANEGLTLTTLEAIAHGVPVVSTDVGAQRDIIPARALISRNVHRAVREGAAQVLALKADESARRALWEDEKSAEERLLAHRSANDWFAQEVSTW